MDSEIERRARLADDYITPQNLADLLHVSRTTVYSWIQNKELVALKIGNTIRISKLEVENRGLASFLNEGIDNK